MPLEISQGSFDTTALILQHHLLFLYDARTPTYQRLFLSLIIKGGVEEICNLKEKAIRLPPWRRICGNVRN